MGMMEEWDFKSAGDYAAFGAPDFPDVHRAWVRREWVSGSQGLVNQHGPSGRMAVPRLYDYGGVGHCMLLPDVPYQVCEPAYGQLAPTSVVVGAEDQTQSNTQTGSEAQTQAQDVQGELPEPSPSPLVKYGTALLGVGLLALVVIIFKP